MLKCLQRRSRNRSIEALSIFIENILYLHWHLVIISYPSCANILMVNHRELENCSNMEK